MSLIPYAGYSQTGFFCIWNKKLIQFNRTDLRYQSLTASIQLFGITKHTALGNFGKPNMKAILTSWKNKKASPKWGLHRSYTFNPQNTINNGALYIMLGL